MNTFNHELSCSLRPNCQFSRITDYFLNKILELMEIERCLLCCSKVDVVESLHLIFQVCAVRP